MDRRASCPRASEASMALDMPGRMDAWQACQFNVRRRNMKRVSAIQTRRQTGEIIVGMLVLAVLLLMLVLAIAGRYRSGGDCYNLKADFNQIDGLSIGSDVRLAGITVGHVATSALTRKPIAPTSPSLSIVRLPCRWIVRQSSPRIVCWAANTSPSLPVGTRRC